MDFEEFINIHLDLKNLPLEIQKYRFEHYNSFKKKSIEKVKEERNKIILENKILKNARSSNIYTIQTSQSAKNIICTIDHMMEKLVEDEKKNIEKIKKRGEMEIQFLIENKIKIELLKEKNEEKLNKIKKKEENNKLNMIKLQKENEELRKIKEQKRINEYERINNEKLEKYKMKQEKEEKRYKELKEEEKKRKELQKKREQEDFIRVNLHKNLINEQLKNNIEEINKKRLKYEQKEKEYIENLLNKRKELKKINEMKKERMSLSMRRNKIIIEQNFERIRNEIENKEKEKEKRLDKLNKNKENAILKQKETNEKKRNEILNSMKNIEEINKEKKLKFFEKMERLEQSIFLKEIKKNEDSKNKIEHYKEHYEKVLLNKSELDKQFNVKKEEIINKIDNINKRVFNQKKNNEIESLKKLEEIKAKQEEKDYFSNRQLKVKEYKNDLKIKENEKKEKKFEEFKTERKKVILKQKVLYDDIKKEKNQVLNKFDTLIRQKKKVDINFLKEIFPDNEEMIKNLSKNNFKKKNSEENILKNSNNNTIKNKNLNLSNLNYYKSEIDRKVEELSNRLRNEMNKAIEEEKINELKRSKEYSNSFDINDKKKIEEKNAIERENANKRILKMKENFDKTLKMYEEKLKKEYIVFD